MAASIFSKLGKLAPRVRNRLWAPLASIPLGRRKHCVMCGNHVGRFMPFENGWRGAPPILQALEVVGSDLDHFECPRCGAHDRERHLFMYMERSGLLDDMTSQVIVHFAPEQRLSAVIADLAPAGYIKCDLFPHAPDVRRENLLDMSFATESVDLLIANHILEHVADDRAAMAEIKRVLRPGGLAILQTPFSEMLEATWEDPGIQSDDARLQAYGQEDHVRLFGRDIVSRFASSGLEACIRIHDDVMADVESTCAGVNRDEPFFLFRKPQP